MQNEIVQLVTEIDRVSETTKFNETYLLKGTGKDAAKFTGVTAGTGGAGSLSNVNATLNIVRKGY